MKPTHVFRRCLKPLDSGIRVTLVLFATVAFAGAQAQTNTRTGVQAGAKTTTGSNNTSNGFAALTSNITGDFNTAIGSNSLRFSTGSNNTAVGFQSLFRNKSGNFNVAVGDGALLNNLAGSFNIGVGEDAGNKIKNGSNNIAIGNRGFPTDNGNIRIGTPGVHKNTFLAGVIRGNGAGLKNLKVPTSGLTGKISSGQIAPAAITTAQLAPAAVTTAQLAPNLVLSGTTTGTFSGNVSAPALSSGNATISNANGSVAFDPFPEALGANLVGVLTGATAGAQIRFQKSGSTDFIDIGQNASEDFVVEGNDNVRLTVTKSGNNTMSVSGAGNALNPPNSDRHVVLIESTQDFASSLLALKSGDANPGGADNFITFYNSAGGTMGAIDGVNSTTVAYKTTGADFAEILPIADSAEPQVPAEIVPVHAGEIGNWVKADHFMVISDQAGFVGNDPGSEVEAKGRHHRIAFLGQVPVKVHGTVSPGDYVIASDRNDGTGIAKAAADIGVSEMSRVVGRAWEGSAEEGLKTVNTAVGLDQTSLVVPTLQRLERENQELRERLQKLEERLAEPSSMVHTVRNQ